MPQPAEACRHIHLDASGGVAGDMFVAALLDALPDLQARVLADARAVLPPGAGEPFLEGGTSNAIRCKRFGLKPAENAPHHHASHFTEMVRLIERAPLHPGTASHAVAILTVLAKAEAAIHQVPIAEVHFHEIGDWDSLLDVVAAGSIAAALEGASWSVSPLPLGGGLVRTRHGLLPVPAPATAEILKGFAWRDDGVSGERVTPTGAAILRHLVKAGRPPALELEAVGTGAGTRHLPEMPNILRAMVARLEAPGQAERITVLSFEVDDMTGEEIGTACDRLRALDGVLDLSTATRRGKKNRPMESFRLLVRPDALAAVQAACLTETSTIGLRWHEESRLCLIRELDQRDGIRRKRVRRPGGVTTFKAESDDLTGASLAERRRLARQCEED
ncbi:nickel pincer cofactor biosynthesis protein LarC [Geminicoccus roseus]|uniref:LarC family nickel insertion protein n=1 Tax=Geminicoccus roseus TaxID=404900 RepID=UPI0004264B26|nr:LarC family nickel insertion protein [Geminicoccus roseus]